MSERLKIRDKMREPQIGWTVRNPEDDYPVKANTYFHMVAALRAYRISKNYPIGSNFEGDLQSWLCMDLPEDYCMPAVPFDPENATPAQKVGRFMRELGRWAKQGFPVVTQEVRDERMDTCNACPLFRPEGNLGMGQCTAPGCGCTKLKLWLDTSRCNFPGGSKWKR